MEKSIVKNAIDSMKECGFNCMPITTYRDKAFKFKDTTLKMVEEANCQLKWLDTMKGGCWHIIPN